MTPNATAAVAMLATARRPTVAVCVRPMRHQTAAATEKMQATFTATPQLTRVSLPVPRPCISAIGQQAYAAQCTTRHAR